jgi:hypothetical protein
LKKISYSFSPHKSSYFDDPPPMVYARSQPINQLLDPAYPFSPFELLYPARHPPMPKRPFDLLGHEKIE